MTILNRAKLALLSLVLSVCVLSGCATADKVVLSRPASVVAVVKTNEVIVPTLVTNSSGKVTPAAVKQVVLTTNYHEEVSPDATYSVSPLAQAAIQTVGVLPSPIAPILSGILSALVGGYATYRNRQRVSEQLVSNIEGMREVIRNTAGEQVDKEVVEYIKSSQEQAGVSGSVRKIVNKTTKTRIPRKKE